MIREHKMHLQQMVRDKKLTGYARAYCDCGDFDHTGKAVDVAIAMLAHKCEEASEVERTA